MRTGSGAKIRLALAGSTSLTLAIPPDFGTPPSGGGSTAFGDADLFRGALISISAPTALAGETGSYSATGLPLGMSINTSSGVISGTPLSFTPRATVTVTRGAGNATCLMGVKYSDFDDPPPFYVPNFDPNSVSAWTTDVTASSEAALTVAMKDAIDNTGSAGSPKFHRITYTGPDITGTFNNSDATAPLAGRDYTFLVVEGQGQDVGQLRWGYKAGQVTMRNFLISSLTGGAAPTNAFYSSNICMTLRKCRVGPWWTKIIETADNTELLRAYGSQGICIEACHFAGWSHVAFANYKDMAAYEVDCLYTNGGGDVERHYNYGGLGSGAKMWVTGRCTGRHLQPDAANHGDMVQTGAQTASGYDDVLHYYGVYYMGECPLYGTTGWRLQTEGGFSSASSQLIAKHCMIAQSGYDGVVAGTNDARLNDIVLAPAPGIGSRGPRVTFNDGNGLTPPGASSLHNIVAQQINYQGGWVGNSLTVTGRNTSYTANDKASIEAVFPNMTGAVVVKSRHVNTDGPLSIYVPDEPDFYHHPTSFRAMVSNFFQPSGGWMDKDPANYPTMLDWGAVPTTPKPVLTGGSLASTTISISTTGTDGWIWWEVSQQADKPSRANLCQGAQADGEFVGGSTVAVWGRTRCIASGANSIPLGTTLSAGTYYAHLYHERLDGAISLVETITGTV